MVKQHCSNFRTITASLSGVQIFFIFTLTVLVQHYMSIESYNVKIEDLIRVVILYEIYETSLWRVS